MLTKRNIVKFADNPGNEIELGQCDRNTYRFYQEFKALGASICTGIADSYRDGILSEKGVHHFWNLAPVRNDQGQIDTIVVDIYSMKSNKQCDYRNHRKSKAMTARELEDEMKLTEKMIALGSMAISEH